MRVVIAEDMVLFRAGLAGLLTEAQVTPPLCRADPLVVARPFAVA